VSWDSRFAEPIELPGGVRLASLREANRVDFDGLVRSLQDYWSSISAKFPGVDDITVIGIDLTKRSC
jgi:hypothetical protein